MFLLSEQDVYDSYYDEETGDYYEYEYVKYEYYYGTPIDLTDYSESSAQVEYYYFLPDNSLEEQH